jgi:DNA-binding NtrC family response regulator
MDGLEAIRLVRKSKPDLPIIVISGSAGASTPDFLNMATKLGAIESIQKPFRPNTLFEVVEKCLQSGVAGKTAPSL